MSDNLQKGHVAAHAFFAFALIVTTLLATLHTFGSNVLASKWSRLVVILGLVGAVYLGFDRDFYMPFLGPTVLPTTVLKVGTPADASVSVSIDAPANVSHVVYWAANPSTMSRDDPMEAYRGFNNAGIVAATNGRATLRLACPGTYKVGWGRLLPRHVHYRYIYKTGVLSGVQTASVTCP